MASTTKDAFIAELRSQLACAIALIEERDRVGTPTPTSKQIIAEGRALLARPTPKR